MMESTITTGLSSLTAWNSVLPYLGTAIVTAVILLVLVWLIRTKNGELLQKRYNDLNDKQDQLSSSMNTLIENLKNDVERYRKLAEFELEKRVHQEREHELKVEMMKEEISALRVEIRKLQKQIHARGIDKSSQI